MAQLPQSQGETTDERRGKYRRKHLVNPPSRSEGLEHVTPEIGNRPVQRDQGRRQARGGSNGGNPGNRLKTKAQKSQNSRLLLKK